MPDTPNKWMPRKNWDDMATGNNPLAEYARQPFQEILISERGYWVADLERSRVYLNRMKDGSLYWVNEDRDA